MGVKRVLDLIIQQQGMLNMIVSASLLARRWSERHKMSKECFHCFPFLMRPQASSRGPKLWKRLNLRTI